MEIAETVRSGEAPQPFDLMLVVKVLCIVLITIKLTRMFCRRSSHFERIVAKLSMPYYSCFDAFSLKELRQHVQVIRNTIFNRCVPLPHFIARLHGRLSHRVTIDETRNSTIYFYQSDSPAALLA